MRTNMKKLTSTAAVMLLAVVAGAGCSSELADNAAPVELIATTTQNLNTIEITGNDPNCAQPIATVQLQAIAKNPNAVGPFVDVRVTRYRVSYQRTDGGTQVPAPFVRSLDTLLTVGGGTTGLSGFLAFENGVFTQAPFAALYPNNGGRDPQTGRPIIRMEIILEVFGQTLAGDNVYDVTRVPLDICFDCGCS